MSTPLTLIAAITAVPDHAGAPECGLCALIVPLRAEAGCLQYDPYQSRHDPHLFCMIERWRGDVALEWRQNTEYSLRFSRDDEALLQSAKVDQLYRLA